MHTDGGRPSGLPRSALEEQIAGILASGGPFSAECVAVERMLAIADSHVWERRARGHVNETVSHPLVMDCLKTVYVPHVRSCASKAHMDVKFLPATHALAARAVLKS